MHALLLFATLCSFLTVDDAFGTPWTKFKAYVFEHDLPLYSDYSWKIQSFRDFSTDCDRRQSMLPSKGKRYAFRVLTVDDIAFRLEEIENGVAVRSHDLLFPSEERQKRTTSLDVPGEKIRSLTTTAQNIPQRIALETRWKTTTPSSLHLAHYLNVLLDNDDAKQPRLYVLGTNAQPVVGTYLPQVLLRRRIQTYGHAFIGIGQYQAFAPPSQVHQVLGDLSASKNSKGEIIHHYTAAVENDFLYFCIKAKNPERYRVEQTDSFMLVNRNKTEVGTDIKTTDARNLRLVKTEENDMRVSDLPREFQQRLFPDAYKEAQQDLLRGRAASVLVSIGASSVIGAIMLSGNMVDPTAPDTIAPRPGVIVSDTTPLITEPTPLPNNPPTTQPPTLEEREGTIGIATLLRIRSDCQHIARALDQETARPFQAISAHIDHVVSEIQEEFDFSSLTIGLMRDVRNKLNEIKPFIERELSRESTKAAATRLYNSMLTLDRIAVNHSCEASLIQDLTAP